MYAEAGVGLPEEVRDQPDFIGFELDFMRHLSEKESQAWAEPNQAKAKEVLEKELQFLKEHILRWIPHFCDLMLKDAQLDFYRGIARLTKGFVQGEVNTTAEIAEMARTVQTT
jgi:putative dimethyl sulfoxide reductase chaperone